jgi:hypothetical protein
LATTLFLDGFARKFFYPCPPELVTSGLCGADWYQSSVDAATCFGAGLAALLIVLGCVSAAPAYKKIVALITFVCGAVAALYMGFATQAFDAMVTAIFVGAVTTGLVFKEQSGGLVA